MKGSVSALREFGRFNSSLTPEKDALIYKSYYHLGIAVDTPEGLVVPVIRDVDRKGITELSRELGAVSARAREGKLGLADLQGACFTISSLGGIGGAPLSHPAHPPPGAVPRGARCPSAPALVGRAVAPRRVLAGPAAGRATRRHCGRAVRAS